MLDATAVQVDVLSAPVVVRTGVAGSRDLHPAIGGDRRIDAPRCTGAAVTTHCVRPSEVARDTRLRGVIQAGSAELDDCLRDTPLAADIHSDPAAYHLPARGKVATVSTESIVTAIVPVVGGAGRAARERDGLLHAVRYLAVGALPASCAAPRPGPSRRRSALIAPAPSQCSSQPMHSQSSLDALQHPSHIIWNAPKDP